MHDNGDLEIPQGGEPLSLKNVSLETIKPTFFKILKKRNTFNYERVRMNIQDGHSVPCP